MFSYLSIYTRLRDHVRTSVAVATKTSLAIVTDSWKPLKAFGSLIQVAARKQSDISHIVVDFKADLNLIWEKVAKETNLFTHKYTS